MNVRDYPGFTFYTTINVMNDSVDNWVSKFSNDTITLIEGKSYVNIRSLHETVCFQDIHKAIEYENKVLELTKQLEDLVNALPDIPALDESLDQDYDQSKSAYAISIAQLELYLDDISDLYFDKA